jgi:hypothetical protein
MCTTCRERRARNAAAEQECRKRKKHVGRARQSRGGSGIIRGQHVSRGYSIRRRRGHRHSKPGREPAWHRCMRTRTVARMLTRMLTCTARVHGCLQPVLHLRAHAKTQSGRSKQASGTAPVSPTLALSCGGAGPKRRQRCQLRFHMRMAVRHPRPSSVKRALRPCLL